MTTIPLLTPEEIAVRSGNKAPLLHLPSREALFADREVRLRQRAAGHAMRDYLLLMAELTRAQHALLQDHPQVELPDADALAAAVRASRPPLPAGLWPRDPQWPAPFIGAALQVYWTHLVLATEAAHGVERIAPFGRIEDATRCPCCGFLPVASMVRQDASSGGLRYLQCALCATQWHMVRVKCTNCEGSKGVHYESLEPLGGGAEPRPKPAVEAEACDECGSYLKIVRKDRDPEVEPVADDLASLTLDLLVSEAGFARHGANLLLLFGDPDVSDEGAGG